MKVVVAEKPSVARDLARVLGATSRRDGYLEGNGWTVTWALGHLAELKTPDEYDPALKRWTLEALPFVPEHFELKPAGDAGARRQLQIVAEHCRTADELICGTDAGREGELIFRYLLDVAGCADRPFHRLWLNSLTESAIRDALAAMRPGTDYEPLHAAARCRSEADWIVGLNATRAYTVRFGGGQVLWSVGRVQTPVLALIARRDDEIRTFDPRPFWELRTRYRGARFKHQGERSATEAEARALLERVQGQPFVVQKVQRKRENIPPPLLYDLTQLQRDLNLRHGMSAARGLEVAQKLYERKLLTYPRTDCRHLTNDMHDGMSRTLRALRPCNPEAIDRIDLDNLPAPRRVFDDSKVTDHHAIVPTGNRPEGLPVEEQRTFDLVMRRTIQAFLPDKQQDVTTVEGVAAEVPFRARGVQVVEPGWSAVDRDANAKAKKRPRRDAAAEDDDDQELPPFEQGEQGPHEPELHEGSTKPPRPYTENTLLGAMETAGKLVDDEQLREALKARGLGTPATRASIVETLLSRRYITRDKKALRVTDLGRYLVAIVRDPLLKSPELTGEWEHKLKEVEAGSQQRQEFMAEIVEYANRLIGEGVAPAVVQGLGSCPRCGKPAVEGRTAFGCSDWNAGCAFVLPKTHRGATVTTRMASELLHRGIALRPIELEGESDARILCLTAAGGLIDIAPPSRDAQRGRRGGGRKPSGRGATPAAAPPARTPEPTRKSSPAPTELPACPACGRALVEGERGFGCSGWRGGCCFVVWKQLSGKAVSKALVTTLVTKGRTRLAGGFRTQDGGEARGRLVLDGTEVRVELEAAQS